MMGHEERISRQSEHEREYWSGYYLKKIAANSSKKFSAYWWEYYHRQITAYMRAIVSSGAGVSVLEAGSGTGKASILSFPDSRITLLDIAPEGLELAKGFASRYGVEGVRFVTGNIFSMPFEDGEFDLVWNVGVVEHYDADLLSKILEEMLRVTKVGGIACVAIPNFKSPPAIKARLLSHERLGKFLRMIPGYRNDTEKEYAERDIRLLFDEAALSRSATIEHLDAGYAGSPFLIGTPAFLIRALSPLVERAFIRRKFLLLIPVKRIA